MQPVFMALVIAGLVGLFAWSAQHRWRLLRTGAPTYDRRLDRIGERLKAVWTFALYQRKMRYYFWAGVAHQLIFLGFIVLLLRSIMLWGRGFEPTFNLWILGPEPALGLPLGHIYQFLKDVFAILVLIGTAVFFYYRVVRPQRRMSLGVEGLIILGIITTMMLADLLYDGASSALNHRFGSECTTGGGWCDAAATIIAPLGEPPEKLAWQAWPEPGGSLAALVVQGAGIETLVVLAHLGFWTHSSLVLIFLNILPYTKHFHIITAIPNVFFNALPPLGRLSPIAESSESLMNMVDEASQRQDMQGARIGFSRIEHFSWKDMLDFYTCTECGRCSDNCPATKTGKILSPKHLLLDLRNHLYERRAELIAHGNRSQAESADSDGEQKPPNGSPEPINLVPNVVHEDVLWACTTCRACEEQCPVQITYVDKIVQMRRNLVMMRGEFPAELNKPFEGMEVNGNPWNLSRMDRPAWAEGLEIPTLAEKPDTKLLFWVGCAASFDDRAKKIARATARLLKKAGVDFAILGQEESCTGDPARRSGNEFLFATLAETNIATLNGYKAQGGIETIITTCPHCFNTLRNEYPEFGGRFEVVHHVDFLLGLIQQDKLEIVESVPQKVAYHDACYLGRHNGIYESPRDVLRRIPGIDLVEVEHWSKKRGLCCGAGGAQMWMEEQNRDRVNVKRTLQLVDTGAQTFASACPFCMTMLSDGIKATSKEDSLKNLDVAELLAIACGVSDSLKKPAEASTQSSVTPA